MPYIVYGRHLSFSIKPYAMIAGQRPVHIAFAHSCEKRLSLDNERTGRTRRAAIPRDTEGGACSEGYRHALAGGHRVAVADQAWLAG